MARRQHALRTSAARRGGEGRRKKLLESLALGHLGTPARPKWPHIKLPEHAWDAGNTRGQARAILAAVEIPSRNL